MFDHLGTIMWLKWRLLRHSMTKATGVLAAIMTVLVVVGVVFASLGLSVGLFVLGAFEDLAKERGLPVLAAADVLVFLFCSLWVASILTEIQRSDVVDLRKMMYLPVSLKSVFGINFAFSLLTPAGVLFVFPGLAFVAGLAIRQGAVVLLGAFTVVAFYFAIAGWTYYVRGWLAALMENKRRRRMLLMMLPMVFIVIVWVPQLLIRWGPRWMPDEPLTVLMVANVLLPPGWLPLALQSLVLGDVQTAFACTMGFVGLAVLPLSMGYRATRRHYLGIESRRQRKRERKKSTQRGAAVESLFVGRTIPGFDEETSALALAGIKMLSRHPMVRMQLIAPFLVGLFLFAMYFFRAGGLIELPAIVRNAVPTAALAWPLLNAAMLFANIFGTDGNGFRSLILLPTPRRKYLLGRNIAFGSIFGAQMAAFAVIAFAIFRPSPLALLIALVNVVYTFLLVSALGNLCSLYLPFKFSSDSMRGAGNKPIALLTAFMFLFLLPLIFVPPLVCALVDPALAHVFEGWWFPGGLVLSLVFVGLVVLGYRWTLDVCGDILAARETRILEAVTKGND